MEITYYLNEGTQENLYCLIRNGKDKTSFSLKYSVDLKLWDTEKGEVNNDDPYFFTLQNLKMHLFQRYSKLETEGKDNLLNLLKEEAYDILKYSYIQGAYRKMFNIISDRHGMPKYDGYLLAFEKYTGLKSQDYRVEILDYSLHFHTKARIYEMDTYEGKTALLKDIIKNRSYFDINELTDDNIWSEIYDEEISKNKFLPIMGEELECCLSENYQKAAIYSINNKKTKEYKNKSREQFRVFTKRYNKQVNVIDLAWEIDQNILYPIAVITMTNIFDLDSCCAEYCELEFSDGEWKAIFMDAELENEDDDLPVFYIKSYT
nr:hypothetical protein [Pedobacter sp. ASV2]